MNDVGERRSPRFRLIVIVVILMVVSAITLAAALLVENAELRWGVGPVLHLLTTGIMLLVSGVCVNALPRVVTEVWRLKREAYEQVVELLHRLGQALRRPLRLSGVAAIVAALMAAGVFLRPPPTGLEPGELVVMTAFPDDPGDARSMLAEQWNRLNPENRVKFHYAPVNSDEQHARMVNDAKPGGEHLADLYVLDIPWMEEFAVRDYVRPLDMSRLQDRDLGDFVPKILDTCYHDGKLWGLPLNSDVGLIFTRTGIPGVQEPQTWDDYFGATAKAGVATARTSSPGIESANAAQLAADDEMLTITALEAIWAAGGRVVGTNGQAALTSDRTSVDFTPADLSGIEKLAAASRDPDLVLTGGDEAKETSAEVAAKTFGAGRTSYMRNWAVASDAVGEKVEFEVTAPPTASVLGGQNLTISSTTDKPRAAQALMQFLTNFSSQQILSEVGGFVPTRQSAFTYSRRPEAEQLRTALNQARLRPITPNYTEFSNVFRQGIARALNNDGNLEESFGRELAEILTRP